MIEEEKKRKEE